jgi:hypothetical protein
MDLIPEVINELYETEPERRRQYRKAFIIDSDPKLFLTIKFLPPPLILARSGHESQLSKALKPTLSDSAALQITNELLKRINKKLFGRDTSSYLTGVGCLEYQKSRQPHLHFTISNDINPDTFLEATNNVIRSARRHKKPFRGIDASSVDVGPVDDAEAAADYITKRDKMLLLDATGILE